MKIGRLYIKIFLSFLVVLIITEALIFALFIYMAGRQFRARFEHHMRGQIAFAKELVEDKIHFLPHTPVSQNPALIDLIRRMGETYGGRVWLTGPGDRPLIQSFDGDPPREVEKQFAHGPDVEMGSFALYKDFGRRHRFYVRIPIQLNGGQSGTLHGFYRSTKKDIHKGGFIIGLVTIGVIIALLVIPVSRQITKPLSELRTSALRFSKGNLSHRSSMTGSDEIGQLGRTFNTMAERLERLIEGGKELTANVSHELRSPLTRMRVAEEIIRKQLKTGHTQDTERHLNHIREDIQALDHLIDRILEYSKLDIHKTSFEKRDLDIAALLRRLLKTFEAAIDNKEIVVHQRLPSRAVFPGNEKGIQSAFTNLLDNAIKYAPNGGEMRIELLTSPDHLRITMANTYRPFSEDELKKLFDPFYRVEGTQDAGTGLGLAIAKKVIERHEGSIHASNSAIGFEITVQLPK